MFFLKLFQNFLLNFQTFSVFFRQTLTEFLYEFFKHFQCFSSNFYRISVRNIQTFSTLFLQAFTEFRYVQKKCPTLVEARASVNCKKKAIYPRNGSGALGGLYQTRAPQRRYEI